MHNSCSCCLGWQIYHGNMFLSLDGNDYSLIMSSVTFTGPPMPQCIMIELIEDFIIEGTHSFSVQISNFGCTNMGSPTSATVNINGKYVSSREILLYI